MQPLIIIEFEKQERNETTSRPNFRDNTKLDFHATQPALLWNGDKYPDKFNFRLYVSDNKAQVDAAQPLPAGKYQLKSGAFGIAFENINCDFSQLEPVKA